MISNKIILFYGLKYLIEKNIKNKYVYKFNRLDLMNPSQISFNISESNDGLLDRSLSTGARYNRIATVKLDCLGSDSSALSLSLLDSDIEIIRDTVNSTFGYKLYVKVINPIECEISETQDDGFNIELMIVLGSSITNGIFLGYTLEKEYPRETINFNIEYYVGGNSNE